MHVPIPRTRAVLALAFAGALAVYTLGAAPTVLTGDSAEIQSVAFLGGVVHPTGYPTAMLAGRLLGRLLPGDPARRITMMSVVFGAVAVALVVRLLVELGLSLPGALAGGVLYGSTYTFWSSALRAEVYTCATTLALLALWRTVVALRSGRAGTARVAGVLLGLTLTGHLVYALPVAALGLALAWRVSHTASRPIPALAALAACFLAGLTPYLWLVWAHTRSYPMDYLRYTELGFFPAGPLPPYFDSAWKRVWWLITARNRLPPESLVFDPRAFGHGVFGSAVQLSVELGPIGVLFALLGLRRQLSERGGLGPLFVAMFALSVTFTAALASGWMTAIFLTPATLVLCLWAAFGMDALAGWIAARRPHGAALALACALLVPLLVALPAYGLRAYARERSIGPLHVDAEGEPDDPIRGFIPSLRGYREPRRYAEAVLAAVPESALVIGRWSELMTLLYLREVEGRRPDLSYQPLVYPNMMPRVTRWQREHSAGRALAVVSGMSELRVLAVAPESLAVAAGRWVYLLRTPLVSTPRRIIR